MRDLREGVKLKKVQERQYNPLPIEYQLTPYEMLMDDIRSKRYKLRKVMVSVQLGPQAEIRTSCTPPACCTQPSATSRIPEVDFSPCTFSMWYYPVLLFQVNGSIPQRLKKSAHEVILDFIRSRPPLNPVSAAQDLNIKLNIVLK